MSDGINILFGKGPFGKLRDRGSHRAADVNLPLDENQKTDAGLDCLRMLEASKLVADG